MSDPPSIEWFGDDSAAKVLPLRPVTPREEALVLATKKRVLTDVAELFEAVCKLGLSPQQTLEAAAKGLRNGIAECG